MTYTLSTHSDAVHAALHLLADDMGCEIPPRTPHRNAPICAPS